MQNLSYENEFDQYLKMHLLGSKRVFLYEARFGAEAKGNSETELMVLHFRRKGLQLSLCHTVVFTALKIK